MVISFYKPEYKWTAADINNIPIKTLKKKPSREVVENLKKLLDFTIKNSKLHNTYLLKIIFDEFIASFENTEKNDYPPHNIYTKTNQKCIFPYRNSYKCQKINPDDTELGCITVPESQIKSLKKDINWGICEPPLDVEQNFLKKIRNIWINDNLNKKLLEKYNYDWNDLYRLQIYLYTISLFIPKSYIIGEISLEELHSQCDFIDKTEFIMYNKKKLAWAKNKEDCLEKANKIYKNSDKYSDSYNVVRYGTPPPPAWQIIGSVALAAVNPYAGVAAGAATMAAKRSNCYIGKLSNPPRQKYKKRYDSCRRYNFGVSNGEKLKDKVISNFVLLYKDHSNYSVAKAAGDIIYRTPTEYLLYTYIQIANVLLKKSIKINHEDLDKRDFSSKTKIYENTENTKELSNKFISEVNLKKKELDNDFYNNKKELSYINSEIEAKNRIVYNDIKKFLKKEKLIKYLKFIYVILCIIVIIFTIIFLYKRKLF